jgi:hypothetical protein
MEHFSIQFYNDQTLHSIHPQFKLKYFFIKLKDLIQKVRYFLVISLLLVFQKKLN